MKHVHTATALVACFLTLMGCGQQAEQKVEDPAKAAYREFRDGYLDADTKAEQVALVERFVTDHPTNRYASYYVVDIIDHYDRLGEPETAYRLVEPVLEAANDPEARFNIGTALAATAAELGRPLDLESLISNLEDEGPLDFYQTLSVLDAAAETGTWDLEERYANQMIVSATPDAFRANYPDREFSDDEVASRVATRKVYGLTHKAWAAYNQGRVDEAMTLFVEADGLTEKNYVGITGTPLETYWGTALWRQGDSEGALEKLAPEVVFGDADSAEPILRQAYAAVHGGDDGFENYLSTTRRELAPTVDDFTLLDYQGNEISLSEARGDSVMLLAFWFPT